ncbi:pyruvate dehydrogenase [Niabella ginsenosidivorans]|uniref:Pyruvate dehydrogenase n=1 Tax=Niabella ginsenosidivorans TaxID=1176587 RepID=A0A1A9I598_9BACT|nr:thiamine pyrophosphate-dependent enzyme [Niabella ginsenosidivorans]ANH81870.1 pyruvate dehydrogenase [Niabella ginsenosidivorans]
MPKNVSDVLVETLVRAGVKRIYAVTGDSLNPVNDAVRRDGRLQWIHVRHEETGAYAASMDAELNGIGCCMGSSGPGHVHLINGLYDANRSGNPVIAIATTAPSDKLGTSYFQETNVTKLFDDCSKFCFMANTPQQAIQAFHNGIQEAISRKGVAVVGLPGDVAAMQASHSHSSSHNFYTNPQVLPVESNLKELADLINKYSKVMLYCGYGSRNAQQEVLELAGKIKSPLGFTLRGKIFYDKEDNPYAVGLTGLLGAKSNFKAMHDAELVLMLGTDFPYSEFLSEKNIMVQIDEKPERLGRRCKADYGYCGNIQATLKALLPLIETKNDDRFLNKMTSLHKEVEKNYESYIKGKSGKEKIHPEYVACLVNELAADDAIFSVDTGMCATWAAKYIKGKKNRYLTGSFNHGSMANAMPMSIGAALSHPERQVVALCGDGGISMLLGDLMTISQYRIPVKIIVFNNRTLGMVKLEMQVAGYLDWQTDMVNPDFEKVAEAMNIRGWTVKDTDQLEGTLKEAFVYDGPAMVSVFTDPNALEMPPHISADQVKGFATSMSKMIWDGRKGEAVDVAESGLKYLRELF